MRQLTMRDGKRHRERFSEPSYFLDVNNNRRNPPKLGDVPVSFEPAIQGNNMDFFLEWEGVRHRFHSTMCCQPGNVKHVDMIIRRAAVQLAFVAYGLKEVQKNKRYEERDMVKFIYRFWRHSNDWNGVLQEAWDFLEVRKVMES